MNLFGCIEKLRIKFIRKRACCIIYGSKTA
jgi:hypothetical protein